MPQRVERRYIPSTISDPHNPRTLAPRRNVNRIDNAAYLNRHHSLDSVELDVPAGPRDDQEAQDC